MGKAFEMRGATDGVGKEEVSLNRIFVDIVTTRIAFTNCEILPLDDGQEGGTRAEGVLVIRIRTSVNLLFCVFRPPIVVPYSVPIRE